MSDIPKYTRVPDESQEIEPLTKGARDSFESQPEGSQPRTTYPPNAEASSSGSDQHVTYVYVPKWSEDHQHVLGILGRDRRVRYTKLHLSTMPTLTIQETLAIAREAFDDLAKYSDDRIEFYAKFEDRETPVRVMDAVWSRLVNKPPPFITVKVKDGPEDIEASELNRRLRFCPLICLSAESPQEGLLARVRRHFDLRPPIPCVRPSVRRRGHTRDSQQAPQARVMSGLRRVVLVVVPVIEI